MLCTRKRDERTSKKKKKKKKKKTRGRRNRQNQTSANRTNIRKALRLALISPSEVIAMLKGLKNTRTKYTR